MECLVCLLRALRVYVSSCQIVPCSRAIAAISFPFSLLTHLEVEGPFKPGRLPGPGIPLVTTDKRDCR